MRDRERPSFARHGTVDYLISAAYVDANWYHEPRLHENLAEEADSDGMGPVV